MAAVGWDRFGMTLGAAAFFGFAAWLWGIKRDRTGFTRSTKDWMVPVCGAVAGVAAVILLGVAIAILLGA